MGSPVVDDDSPLSISGNIVGILTFVIAVVAALSLRVSSLRNSDQEFNRVKASLSWFKTESTWLRELVSAASAAGNANGSGSDGAPDLPLTTSRVSTLRHLIAAGTPNIPRATARSTEYQMYTFVMDDLVKLEQRLLEVVTDTELRAEESTMRRWAVFLQWVQLSTSVAIAWMPVRAKAMELVRQRDALTARVAFTQMSMISSRIRELEARANSRELKTEQSLERLQAMVLGQRAEISQLEDVVSKLTSRRRHDAAVDGYAGNGAGGGIPP